MSVLALATAGLAVLVGAASAAADGSLLSRDTVVPGPDEESASRRERERTHRALGIARLLCDVIAGAAAASALSLVDRSPVEATALALVAALAVLLLGEVIPRELGDALGQRGARWLRPLGRGIEALVAPLVAGGMWIERTASRVLPPAAPSAAEREATAGQFRAIVQTEPEVPLAQRAILRRVFSLGDTEVHEVMRPRVGIVGLDRDTPWSEVLDRVRSAQHARLPVYTHTIDDITGILYAKDLLPGVLAGTPPDGGWLSLVRPASFVPETKSVAAQLRDFQTSSNHIAIVVDEFGGTAGLVTIEDILEEIVGEIRDENDLAEPQAVVENGERYWVSGQVSLDELSELIGHHFADEDVSTLGGLIFQTLGRVPRAGEELTLNGFRVVVERLVRHRIDRVYLERRGVAEVEAT